MAKRQPTKPARPVVRPARRPQPKPKRWSRGVVLGSAVAGAVVVVVGFVTVAADREPARDRRASAAQPVAASLQGSHVHGLGVDPADGELYAGTHYGLFRIPEDGPLTAVGDSAQDFMGFTVVGPRHYLASGHPAQGEPGPHNLGLIESTDGGKTWSTVGLAGEADFHALEARHGQIYGFHGGRVFVSKDRQTWEPRAQIPMADFAVSATDPDVLLATTQQGVARSTDGGRSFTLLPGVPALQLVTWPTGEDVIGVDSGGSVYASEDAGATWGKRGSAPGQPHALTASGDSVYLALENRIVRSDDRGRTFKTLYDGE